MLLLGSRPLLERELEQALAERSLHYHSYAVWLGECYTLAGYVAEAMSLGQRVLDMALVQKQQGH